MGSQTFPTFKFEGKARQHLWNEGSLRSGCKKSGHQTFLFTAYPRIECWLFGQFAGTGWARRGIHTMPVKEETHRKKRLACVTVVWAAGSNECRNMTGKSIKPSFWLFNKRLVFCNIFKMKSNAFMNFLARSTDSKQFPLLTRCPSDRD